MDTQGDAFFFAFPIRAGAAVAAAAAITDALAPGPIQLRIGLHTGTPARYRRGLRRRRRPLRGACRRLRARWSSPALAGGRELVEDLAVTDLGEHRLKDIEEPVAIFQLGEKHLPAAQDDLEHEPAAASELVRRPRARAGRRCARARMPEHGSSRSPGRAAPARRGSRSRPRPSSSRRTRRACSGSDLPPCATPSLVTETIAQTLGAKDGLAEHIGERELLLLLDNLEQVDRGCARALRRSCSPVRTSRCS